MLDKSKYKMKNAIEKGANIIPLTVKTPQPVKYLWSQVENKNTFFSIFYTFLFPVLKWSKKGGGGKIKSEDFFFTPPPAPVLSYS